MTNNVNPQIKPDAVVTVDNEQYRVLNTGAIRDNKIYCHLAHMTKGWTHKNRFYPLQSGVWLDLNN